MNNYKAEKMISKLGILGLVLLLILQIAASVENSMCALETKKAAKAIHKNFNEFSADIYEAVSGYRRKNFVFSPISLWTSLPKGSNGMIKIPKNSMRRSRFAKDRRYVRECIVRNLVEILDTIDEVSFNIANRIFINNTTKLNRPIKNILEDVYKSSIQSIDFSNTESSSKIVNHWVDRLTNKQVTKIVEPGNFSQFNNLILTSVTHFKGTWTSEFFASRVIDSPFKFQDGSTKLVSMMLFNALYEYGSIPELSATFVVIPYQGTKIRMVVILPYKCACIKTIEQNLKKVELYRFWTAGLSFVKISVPKFKLETTFEFKPTLADLVMNGVFTNSTMLRKMTDSPIKVSKIIQKTSIEVDILPPDLSSTDEQGPTASVNRVKKRDATHDRTFLVNRPFLVLICTEEVVLVKARVVAPIIKEDSPVKLGTPAVGIVQIPTKLEISKKQK